MAEVTAEAVVVNARLGPVRPFVFVAQASDPLAQQATMLFESMSRILRAKGGWLIESLVDGGSPHGFAKLMERRALGELAWDKVVPVVPTPGRAGLLPPVLACRKPYTMLARAGYPCWAADGHLYTMDLFNPANELMFPYQEDRHRLWAVIPWPPRFTMPDVVYSEVLQETALAVRADYAFGGMWVTEAAMAYVFPDEFTPLDGATRITDLTYPNVIVRTSDLPRDGFERLLRGVTVGSRKWEPAVCREFAGGRYLLLSAAADYGDENVHLGRAIASVLGKPYVSDMLVMARQNESRPT